MHESKSLSQFPSYFYKTRLLQRDKKADEMKGPRKASLPVASGNYPVICHIHISLRDAFLDLTPK